MGIERAKLSGMVFQSRDFRRWGLLAAVLLPGACAFADGPEVRLERPASTPREGETFEVSATAAWKGSSTKFVVTPGTLEGPAWGEGGWDRVEARSTADGTELRFVARFTAKAPGSVSVPELHLNYTDPAEPLVESAPVSPAPDPAAPNAPAVPPAPHKVAVQHALKTDSFVLEIRADRRWLYPYAALAVVALGGLIAGGSVWIARRKAAAAAQEDALAPWQTVEEAFHNARRHRLDGDFYKFYRELSRLVEFAGGEVKSEFGGKLAKKIQEVGFQNKQPTEDEIEGILKDLERALSRWKEEGKAA